jgi:hypothetical protein
MVSWLVVLSFSADGLKGVIPETRGPGVGTRDGS